jgi:hypothetical protein
MPEPASRPELSRRRLLLSGAAAIPAGAVLAAVSRPGAAAAATATTAAAQRGTMRLTWLGHSCFRLEKDGFVAVIDPGIVAPANALDDADAVLITHQVRNTGFLLEDRVFHPGDAYTDPHAPVDLLFVPEFGLFTKFGYAIDFIRQVKPKQASPVHDTGLDPTGLAGADGFLVQDRTPPFAPGTGSPFVRLPKGTPAKV